MNQNQTETFKQQLQTERKELLVELVVHRERRAIPGFELLSVDWLLLQNPRERFGDAVLTLARGDRVTMTVWDRDVFENEFIGYKATSKTRARRRQPNARSSSPWMNMSRRRSAPSMLR